MAKKIDLDGLEFFKGQENGCIAKVETTTTASRAYKTGERFYFKGKLVIATDDIASGGTITLNTNCKLDVLGDDVSELKTALNQELYNESANATKWEQGYWAIASGSATNSTTWIRTKDFLEDSVVKAFDNANLLLYLQAWDKTSNAYIGTWNRTEWSTTYTAGSGLFELNITSFKTKYPNYKFKITVIKTDGTNITPSVNGAQIYFGTSNIENLDNILMVENVKPTYTDGEFINATNNSIASSSGFGVLDPIPLKKYQTIFLTARGYSNSTGMIAVCNENNTARTTVAASIDSTRRTYSYTATEDCYVTGSIRTAEPTDIEIYLDVTKLVNTDIIQYPQMFDNILCIGDSLTDGATGASTSTNKNYPHFLGKLTDATVTKNAHGGWSAKQMWDDDISAVTDFSNYDCVIVYLGTNGGLTDTVSTDCNASDYTQNADTNTGCYGKIVGKIKADAPNCKIFCVAGPNEYNRRATNMNPAVRDIAALYDVGLIDLEDTILSDNGASGSPERNLYRPSDGTHYNVLGYLVFANLLYDRMSNYMQNNPTKYKDLIT